MNGRILKSDDCNIITNIQIKDLFDKIKLNYFFKKGGTLQKQNNYNPKFNVFNLNNFNRSKKYQEGGIIEATEYNPVVVSLKKFDYPELNFKGLKPLDTTNLVIPRQQIIKIQDNPLYNKSLDITLPQLLKEEGINFKITSGFRNGAITKSGSKSNHGHLDQNGDPGAYDIVPIDGNFENFRKQIYSNPRIVSWLQNKGWGILEETTPDIMKKTGATGKHWHFGPDTLAKKMSENNGVTYV